MVKILQAQVELEEAKEDTGFASVIVVDNLPQIPEAKFGKLLNVLTKIFTQIGEIREGGMLMPHDEATKTSLGYAFVEFANEQQAQSAVEQTDGYKLDKTHIFKVCKFDDFEKYQKVPDEYVAPPPKPFAWNWGSTRPGSCSFGDGFASSHNLIWAIHWSTAHQLSTRSPPNLAIRCCWQAAQSLPR